MGSSLYEAWVTRMRVSWMGQKAQQIFGGFAAVLGDMSVDWALQGVLEHLPGYASDPTSIALTANERQLDTYPGEPTAAIAARAPYWLQINKFRGRGLGLLLGLHFAGFDGAILVQQNGRALQLSLPLPAFSGNWDPTPNLVVTNLGTNPELVGAAANHPWWTFDLNDTFCSRFAVLFVGSPPKWFMTHARATFTGAENGGSTPWPTLTWNNAFPDTSYLIRPGGVVVTDGSAAIPPLVGFDPATKTITGVQTTASAPFVGYVDYIAFQSGANPYADLHPSDLQRLRNVIAKWRPAKATCTGIFVCTKGQFSGWPPGNWSSPPASGVASEVVTFTPQ
jgi:hypothetical protein